MAEEITWSAKTYCDCGGDNWFFFDEEKTKTSTSGTSANSLTIYINKAISPNDCSNGYVGVSSTTINGEIEETIIPVNRCLPSCECGKDIIFSSDIKNKTYDASGETSAVTIGTWEGTCDNNLVDYIVGDNIFSSVTIDRENRTIKGYIKENKKNQERSDFFRFSFNGKNCYSGEIFQLPYVSPCFDSETVSLEPLSSDIPCSGGSFYYTINGADCWEILGNVVINPPDMASVYPIQKRIFVTENGYEPRNGTCDFTLVNLANGHTSAFTMAINQEACERPATCTDIEWVYTSTTCTTCDCNENDFTLTSSSPLPIPSGGYNGIIGTVEGCIDKEIMELSDNTWGTDVILQYSDDNNIYLVVSANTGIAREETVNIVYFDRCDNETPLGSSALTLVQEKASSCVNLDITSSSVEFNSDGGSINVGTISGSHTVTKTSDSPSWVTVNTSNGNISLSVNATTVSRNGTITFKVDDDTCSGKEVTISQTVPVSVITYYSPSKANVNLSDFTPAATAETFSNGVGKVEFAEVVTEIKEKAFSGKTSMTGIDIPNSITTIGNSAFTNCYSLSSITIPSGVSYINDHLLDKCTSLSSVTLESKTLQLKPYSISNCPNLRKIEMTSVTACPSDYQNALENSADCPIYVPEEHLSDFWNSSTFQYKDRVIAHIGNNCVVYKASQKLTGDSLKNAYSGEYASSSTKLSILLHTFNSSTKIGKITYDGVVRSFHDGAFDTRAIDYIVLPENIKRIGQTVFQSSNLISIYFPDSLVGLCNSATDWGCDILHNCARLKTVVAGSGLAQIGYGCFSCADETSSLTGITFYSTTPPTLDRESTFGHTIHASIYVPCGQVSTYKSANIWNDSDIKNKIKAIPPCTS